MRREPEPLRMPTQIRGPDRLRFADHMAEHSPTAGEIADLVAGVVVDSRRHELHQRLPVLVQDAERGVLGTDDLTRRVHNRLQDVVEVVAGEDRDTGREQALESLPDTRRFDGWAHTSKCFTRSTVTIHACAFIFRAWQRAPPSRATTHSSSTRCPCCA